MDPLFFVKGLIIGFAMAVPIGPVGVLCIRKTLAEGHPSGLVVGLGAATVDALYSSIAAFGLTFVSDVVASQSLWVRLVGGCLLIYLGIRIVRAKREDSTIPFERKGMAGSYVSALLLALTNPVTIFAFIAVFAALGLDHRVSILSASVLVLGVGTGSSLWFLMLGVAAKFFRTRLSSDGLRWVDRIAGVLLIVSGVAAFMSLLMNFTTTSLSL